MKKLLLLVSLVFLSSARPAQAGIYYDLQQSASSATWRLAGVAKWFASTVVAGTPSVFIDGVAGMIGLGTSSPAAKIHVSSGTVLIDGNASTSFQVGVSSFIMTSAGKLGIGTATPQATLDVTGGSVVFRSSGFNSGSIATVGPGLCLYTTNTSVNSRNYCIQDGFDNFGQLEVFVSLTSGTPSVSQAAEPLRGTLAMSIDKSANVGFGTNAPVTPFEVSGNAKFDSSVETGNGQVSLGANLYYNSGLKYRASDFAGYISYGWSTAGDWDIFTAPSGTAGAAATNTSRLHITNAGFVGIGRPSPADTNSFGGSILDINGPVYARQNGSPTHYALLGAASSHEYLEANDDMYVYTGANGNPSMYFSSTNNNIALGGYSSVGPYNVDVASGIEVQRSGVLDGTGNFVNGVTMGGYDALAYDAAGQYVALGGYHSSQWLGVKLYGNGSPRLTVLSGGNVGIGTTGPGYLLDVNGTANVTTLRFSGDGTTMTSAGVGVSTATVFVSSVTTAGSAFTINTSWQSVPNLTKSITIGANQNIQAIVNLNLQSGSSGTQYYFCNLLRSGQVVTGSEATATSGVKSVGTLAASQGCGCYMIDVSTPLAAGTYTYTVDVNPNSGSWASATNGYSPMVLQVVKTQ